MFIFLHIPFFFRSNHNFIDSREFILCHIFYKYNFLLCVRFAGTLVVSVIIFYFYPDKREIESECYKQSEKMFALTAAEKEYHLTLKQKKVQDGFTNLPALQGNGQKGIKKRTAPRKEVCKIYTLIF